MAISESSMTTLLRKLKEVVKENNILENSADTWSRIGSGDSFSDLGFDSEQALKDWIEANPYSNI